MLAEELLKVVVWPEAVRQPGRPLVGGPRDVALAGPEHGLAKSEGEVRIRTASLSPDANDAESRLVEGNRVSVRRNWHHVPAILRSDFGDVLADGTDFLPPRQFVEWPLTLEELGHLFGDLALAERSAGG